jgi:hypothetical protein
LAQLQTPDANAHAPGARKFGLGVMLADGFEIEKVGALVTGAGALLIVVVVVGATVVGVTTVVGVEVVAVGFGEPCPVVRDFGVATNVTTREWWVAVVVMVTAARWTRRATVVVVDATVVVVEKVVVVAGPTLAVGRTTFAIAGSAVVLRTMPTTSEPIDAMTTERRGPRREVEKRRLGSPERFCPCVIPVMDQLSKIKSKVPPTTPQHLLNSVERSQSLAAIRKRSRM